MAEKQKQLQDAKDKLAEVEAKMADLKQQYEKSLAEKERLKKESEYTEMMLDRASKLVSGLSGERDRWEETVAVCIGLEFATKKDIVVNCNGTSELRPPVVEDIVVVTLGWSYNSETKYQRFIMFDWPVSDDLILGGMIWGPLYRYKVLQNT